ncbi:hypothetical protein V8G54_006250 [Vigna mungo]|uniref:PORR domain-containing protein n=1 Tax=Vigna mungo TaxID=3915 RepID=A0AAQ3P058_VIGMU
MVRSQNLATCPINADELSSCGSLLEGALGDSPSLPTPSSSCCSPFQDLNLEEADSCVTTAITSGVILLPASLPPVLDFPGQSALAFPVKFPRGYDAQKKVRTWMEEFQKLPYVSPYVDFSKIDPNSDLMEKHIVGVLHEN